MENNDYSAKQWAIGEAISILKEQGNPYPYSYMVGALSVFITQEEAELVLALVRKREEMFKKPLTLKQVSGNLLGSNTYYTED